MICDKCKEGISKLIENSDNVLNTIQEFSDYIKSYSEDQDSNDCKNNDNSDI